MAYKIQLSENAKLYCLHTACNVPLPLWPQVEVELNSMEELGVIKKVTDPTDWCAAIVVVPKPNGSVRICVDMKPLNESVRHSHHQLPTVDETLGRLGGATIFTKLGTNSGFWQIPLDPDSQLLTTLKTPAG